MELVFIMIFAALILAVFAAIYSGYIIFGSKWYLDNKIYFACLGTLLLVLLILIIGISNYSESETVIADGVNIMDSGNATYADDNYSMPQIWVVQFIADSGVKEEIFNADEVAYDANISSPRLYVTTIYNGVEFYGEQNQVDARIGYEYELTLPLMNNTSEIEIWMQ